MRTTCLASNTKFMTTYISNASRELNPSRPEDESVRLRGERVRLAVENVRRAAGYPNVQTQSPVIPEVQITESATTPSAAVPAFPLEQVSAAQRAVDTAYREAA